MPRLWALIGVFIISFSAIFVRLANVEPSTAAFFRATYALPFLLAIWLFQRGAQGLEGHGRVGKVRLVAFVAGLFLGIDMAFWHRAIELIGAGLSTVLGNTQVVFVGFLAWWLHGEKPSRAALLGVPVVFAGVTLISGLGSSTAFGTDPELGVAYGILTGITYAIFLLIFRFASRGQRSPVGPLLDATLGAAVGSWVIGTLDGQLDYSIVWPAHGWLLAVAIGSQVAGWLLIGAALPRLPALETSIILLMQPMLTVVWARILFAERLSMLQGLGMALVLGGVAWLSIRGSAREESAASEVPPVAIAAAEADA